MTPEEEAELLRTTRGATPEDAHNIRLLFDELRRARLACKALLTQNARLKELNMYLLQEKNPVIQLVDPGEKEKP